MGRFAGIVGVLTTNEVRNQFESQTATNAQHLQNALKGKLTHLTAHEPGVAGRIVVKAISSVGYDLYARDFGPPNIASASLVRTLLSQAAAEVKGAKFTRSTCWTEVELSASAGVPPV